MCSSRLNATGTLALNAQVEKLSAKDEQTNINALAELLSSRGLDATDFIDVVDILAKVKKKELDAITKKEEQKEKTNKIFVDKEFVYETRDDVFIPRWTNQEWELLYKNIR